VSADVPADRGPSYDAWVALLDELEGGAAAAADRAGETGSDAPAAQPWDPPAGIGPLPADLADRAARLLRAQLDAESLLQDERARVARHLAAVRSVDPARSPRDSVYLDVLS